MTFETDSSDPAQYSANGSSYIFRILSTDIQLLVYIPAINHPDMPVS
jgi:hypothetical protein